MSMRYAFGARRSRITSQLIVEGGLLGMAEPRRDCRCAGGGNRAGTHHDQLRSRQRALLHLD